MNKTLTINIAGSVFHIDENAYLKLDQYLKAIKRSFPKEEQDEIIHDIEIRIAELFSENITDSNQVITIADVDRVISIMGSPEDYIIDEEPTAKTETKYVYTGTKKLYRDGENAMVGGVLAGLGHYFKIDTVWMRIIFMILVLFYGTGVLLYLILWIIVPEAKTTSQILEMKREPINISTIEKKVMENVNYVTSKINDVDYEHIKNQTKRAGERSGKIILNIIGIFFIVISVLSIFSSIIGISAALINKEIILEEIGSEFPLLSAGVYPFWVSTLLLTSLVTLPFIGLLIIGLRMIYTNIKYVALIIIGLLLLWFISLGLFSIPFLNAKNYESRHVYRTEYTESAKATSEFSFDEATDEIKITLVTEDYFKSDKSKTEGFEVKEINSLLPIEIEILPTFQNEIYGTSEVKDFTINKKKNKIIEIDLNLTNLNQEGNQLIISNNLFPENKTNADTKNAKIVYTIYIPKGKKVYISEPVKALIKSNETLTAGAHWYEMQEDSTLKCSDC
ncbi:PspC domain-containing protein [Myroides odoratimimus]|uniref:PspC domain-containing protein n=1 Tax=Myroides odoratimimus TaxID=76832 RepID=UPI00046862D1|nr:PspC domain-containing protein [Myroides odoratimimus]